MPQLLPRGISEFCRPPISPLQQMAATPPFVKKLVHEQVKRERLSHCDDLLCFAFSLQRGVFCFVGCTRFWEIL